MNNILQIKIKGRYKRVHLSFAKLIKIEIISVQLNPKSNKVLAAVHWLSNRHKMV